MFVYWRVREHIFHETFLFVCQGVGAKQPEFLAWNLRFDCWKNTPSLRIWCLKSVENSPGWVWSFIPLFIYKVLYIPVGLGIFFPSTVVRISLQKKKYEQFEGLHGKQSCIDSLACFSCWPLVSGLLNTPCKAPEACKPPRFHSPRIFHGSKEKNLDEQWTFAHFGKFIVNSYCPLLIVLALSSFH